VLEVSHYARAAGRNRSIPTLAEHTTPAELDRVLLCVAGVFLVDDSNEVGAVRGGWPTVGAP
jgi:hypothetical protein